MYKKGQVFIVASLVIIIIIFSLSAVYTNAKISSEDDSLAYLAQEIRDEIAEVVDYSILNDQDFISNARSLLSIYANNNPQRDIVLMLGNSNGFNVISCTKGAISSTSLVNADLESPGAPSSSLYITDSEGLLYSTEVIDRGIRVIVMVKEEGDERKIIFR